ncbi:MAG: hypothetical protein ACREUU_04370 [Gammaproteobacteria bacterium]
MKSDSHSLPLRRTASGEEIETRPLYVEEWLDTLPYVDFKKTSRLIYEATRATNAQAVKGSARLELVELYNRPYRYYVDSQIKTGAQHTLQSIETMQDQIEMLKMIAVNLGHACKLAAEETLKQKTLWRRTKPPLPALLSSLNYLSHALIFSFLEYAPTPKNVWREMHFAYSFAESLNQQQAQLIPIGGDPKKEAASMTEAYARIVMAAVADPHHLPFGAIWEIYEQLGSWVRHLRVGEFSRTDPPGGRFVVDLESDERPFPLSKFKAGPDHARYRLIDASALAGLAEDQLEQINAGKGLTEGIRFSPYFARSVLGHIVRAYGSPPERLGPREERQGKLNLARGLNAIYFFLNGEKEFAYARSADDGEPAEGDRDLLEGEITPSGNYKTENWNLVDQGRGGFAVIKTDKPHFPLRVGELVAVAVRSAETPSNRKWRLGIVRWMMVRQGKSYRIGVELLAGVALPVAVRALGGSQQDSRFRRGLLISASAKPDDGSLITERGIHISGRQLEIKLRADTVPFMAGPLVETSVAFEHFHLSQK